MLKRLLSTVLARYKWLLWTVIAFQFVQAMAGMFLPTLNSDIINNGVVKNDVGYIWRMGGVMLAITLVQVVQRLAGFTLLDVTIKTGRTHQIRVHLADAGHPIAGDDKYGDFELNRRLAREGMAAPGRAPVRLERMFLHARRLRVAHPASGQALELQAPLPAELSRVVDALQPSRA